MAVPPPGPTTPPPGGVPGAAPPDPHVAGALNHAWQPALPASTPADLTKSISIGAEREDYKIETEPPKPDEPPMPSPRVGAAIGHALLLVGAVVGYAVASPVILVVAIGFTIGVAFSGNFSKFMRKGVSKLFRPITNEFMSAVAAGAGYKYKGLTQPQKQYHLEQQKKAYWERRAAEDAAKASGAPAPTTAPASAPAPAAMPPPAPSAAPAVLPSPAPTTLPPLPKPATSPRPPAPQLPPPPPQFLPPNR